MKVGLFFGSFNPIHVGHMIIANYMLEFSELEKVWFVVSPQNPFKKKSGLLDQHNRLHLCELATQDNPSLIPSSVEFQLPQPSYTIDTLTVLTEQHPDLEFELIMGSDNLKSLPKWKNFERILEYYKIHVYNRPGSENPELTSHPSVISHEVPMMHISATFIRSGLAEGKSMRYFLPEPVYQYLKQTNWYKQ